MYGIVLSLADNTVILINSIFMNFSSGNLGDLVDIPFNLILFSDTPIVSMNLYDLLVIFFTIFYSMFFIVLLYKATKKFINMVFGVFKV